MKIKTNDLKDKALDWAVHQAWCEGACHDEPFPSYATDPSQAYPIIFREGIDFGKNGPVGTPTAYEASISSAIYYGPTPLIAAMRCYVSSKLGDEVEVPKELV